MSLARYRHGVQINEIRVVDGSYAVMRDGEVIGTVSHCYTGSRQWGFYPLRGGTGLQYVPLQDALAEGQKYQPNE